jgi:hypothetical protein
MLTGVEGAVVRDMYSLTCTAVTTDPAGMAEVSNLTRPRLMMPRSLVPAKTPSPTPLEMPPVAFCHMVLSDTELRVTMSAAAEPATSPTIAAAST